MQLPWFRAPSGDDPGTANLCYVALDLPIVHGHAADPAVRRNGATTDFATLLEQTAALAGAMRGTGTRPGDVVTVLLHDPVDQLLALLATLRIGAVHVRLPASDPVAAIDVHQPGLVLSSAQVGWADHTPAAVFLRGQSVRDETREVDWEVAVRAGRNDPAGAEPVAGDSVAFVHERAVRTAEVGDDESTEARWLSVLASGGCLEMPPASG